MSTTIHAGLHDAECASAAGLTIKHRTPVLAFTRALLAAGDDPDAVLTPAWENGSPSLMPTTLASFAHWSVTERDSGQRCFVPFKPHPLALREAA